MTLTGKWEEEDFKIWSISYVSQQNTSMELCLWSLFTLVAAQAFLIKPGKLFLINNWSAL